MSPMTPRFMAQLEDFASTFGQWLRKLVEMASTIELVQNGRIYTGRVAPGTTGSSREIDP